MGIEKDSKAGKIQTGKALYTHVGKEKNKERTVRKSFIFIRSGRKGNKTDRSQDWKSSIFPCRDEKGKKTDKRNDLFISAIKENGRKLMIGMISISALGKIMKGK